MKIDNKEVRQTMVYVNSILSGFLFAVGFFLAQVLIMALFNQRICG